MALASQCVLFIVLVIASLCSFLSTAPAIKDDMGYLDENWFVPVTDSQSVTITPLDTERIEFSCEKTTKIYDGIVSDTVNEDLKKLLSEYNDWGKLLAPTSVAIGILGQLILMANQIEDFPIARVDSNTPVNTTFKYIKHPNSLRATLLQISQKGYLAFLTAHRNMDSIRLLNSAVQSDIKDAVRYLASENPKIIELRLPPTWAKINEAAKRSQALSKEVVDEFNLVLGLIVETELAVSSTKSMNEHRLKELSFDITLRSQSKGFSEIENLILMEKDAKMKEIMDSLEDRKNHLYIVTNYNGGSFIVNLANDWIKEIGKTRYKKVKKFLEDRSQAWTYTYSTEFIDSNTCAQENSEPLLDLVIAFGQYRSSYEHWKSSYRRSMSPFNRSETANTFTILLKSLKPCTEIDSIRKKGLDLVEKLRNPNTFQWNEKQDTLPFQTDINDITISINKLRTAANEVTQKSDSQVEIKADSAWDLYAELKRHQLSQLDSMLKTVEDIIQLNNGLMEIRKNKTRQILDKISSLNITKVSTENMIDVLREGLSELGKLKNDWGELIKFFDKIRTFIESAARHSTGLVEVVQAMSKNMFGDTSGKFLLRELGMNFEKSNEAVLLVRDIADMYVNVSSLYIVERLNNLNTLNLMRVGGAMQRQLLQEKEKLTMDAEEASQGIESYIQIHEKKLNEALKIRHEEMLREYKKILYCVRYHGLKYRAVNDTESLQ